MIGVVFWGLVAKKVPKNIRYSKIVFAYVFVLILHILCLNGCGSTLSSPEQLREFEMAGPIASGVSVDRQNGVQTRTGPYRVIPGDLLELRMPAILRVVSSNLPDVLQKIEPYLCRVSDAGTIILPIVGEMPVAGKKLAEIESSLVVAYFPKYVVNTPAVVCKVAEYRSENARVFTVMGLVNRPNTFSYLSNVQYNLIEALAFAGGLNMVADPRYVKIYRQDANGKVVSATFGIGNKSLADAYNVMIKPGDVIYVDHTLRTRTNAFLFNVFYIRAGADIDAVP